MSKRLISFVKYNKVVLKLYRFFGNLLVYVLSLFTRTRKNRILFVSFGGQKYDDSPRVLYEKIKNDPFFKDYEFIWAFRNPAKFAVDCKAVRIDTIKFYKVAMSSRIWINNSSVERGLKLRRKNTMEINSWHGTPLKKMGKDIHNYQGYTSKQQKKGIQIYCSQSKYDQEIFSRLFDTAKDNILISDLPRNDELFNYTKEQVGEIKERLNIPKEKKVILYAPTYREFNRDSLNNCYIKPPIDFAKWQNKLGKEYVLLFRAHYEIVKVLGVENNEFVYNVSDYYCLNDLMWISDIVISDYSSIYFDYAVLERPMLNFSYDFDEYSKIRGLYFDIHEELGCNINLTEDDLIEEIITLDYDKYCQHASNFKKKYAPNAGKASEIVIAKIKDLLVK